MTDHLAQLNIARMRAPLDDPIMSGFVDQLDHIESLQHYDYQSDHISPLRDRKEWFEPMRKGWLFPLSPTALFHCLLD